MEGEGSKTNTHQIGNFSLFRLLLLALMGCGGKVREAVSQECRAWRDHSASLETQLAKTKDEATAALKGAEKVSIHASASPNVGCNFMYVYSESSLASVTRPLFAQWSCYRRY